MKCNVERLIEALVASELAAELKAVEERAAASRRATYVVTVSRGYGALGKETAQALADRLGVRCCDRTILQEVAKRANVDVELARALDERIKRIDSNNWWQHLFLEKTYSQERYLHHLVKVILNISVKGGVIVGRGAHLILGPERCFRVRIIGSLSKCAERISEREGLEPEAAERRVRQVDSERADYLRSLYGVDANDFTNFDIIINTDRYTVDQAVGMILDAMQLGGYELPPDILKTSLNA